MHKRVLQPDDLYRLRWVSDAQISPDGQQIAYVLTTIDRENDTYRSAIWMVPTTQGLHGGYQFVADGSTPRWSPDGQTLAFISGREGTLPPPQTGESPDDRDRRCGKGKGQIWLISAHGGEARQLTMLPQGAGEPRWSPDGQQILFAAKTGTLPILPKHNGQPEGRARRITRMMYRFNGARAEGRRGGYIYELRTHVFTVPVATGTVVQLTHGDYDNELPAWSPDGQRIAFVSDRRDDRWNFGRSQIWMMQADGSQQEALTDPEGAFDFSHPAWSPDGQQIACIGAPLWHNGGQTDVFLVAPGSAPRCLTEHQFVTFSDAIGSDMGSDHANPTPRWLPDGQALFLIGNARGAGNVYRLDVHSGHVHPATEGLHHIKDYTVDAAGNTLALVLADTHQPGDIFVQWRDTGTRHRLTDVNADLLGEVHVGTPEEFTYTGAHDWTIEGWTINPPDFDPSRKYPLVLEIHGGPNTAYGYSFNLEFQILAGRGYVVLYTNPRGSTSYGREFGQAVHSNWSYDPYSDIMAGVDTVIARGYIDTERMGVLGGSYGGYMTNWIVGHTDRFKAAITQRCVSNLATMVGTSDIGPWVFMDNNGVAPWDDMSYFIEHSPMTYVKNIVTPLLIIHSEEDWRCPIEQAEQLFIALKWLRRDVELIRFEGENHELSRSGTPHLRLENLRVITDWFHRYIPTPHGGNSANGHNDELDLDDIYEEEFEETVIHGQ